MASVNTSPKFSDEFAGFFGDPSDNTSSALMASLLSRLVTYRADRTVDSNIAGAGATVPAWNVTSTHTLAANTQFLQTVQTCKGMVNANVTGVNTNVGIFTLVYNNGNGGSDTTIATINTAATAGGGSGNITAGIPFAITVNTSTAQIPVGSQLQLKVTKAGAGGLELPQMSFEVVCALR